MLTTGTLVKVTRFKPEEEAIALLESLRWPKRGIMGSFHHVSKAHLHRYVEEFAFRYSNRIALGVNDGERAARIIVGAKKRSTQLKLPDDFLGVVHVEHATTAEAEAE